MALYVKALLTYDQAEQSQYLATQPTSFFLPPPHTHRSSTQPSFSLQFAPLQLSCQPFHEGEELLRLAGNASMRPHWLFLLHFPPSLWFLRGAFTYRRQLRPHVHFHRIPFERDNRGHTCVPLGTTVDILVYLLGT
jgi:hypothetical protein